jgi:phage-related protein
MSYPLGVVSIVPLPDGAGRLARASVHERPASQAAIDNRIDLLNGLPSDAPPLAFPHSSQVAGELRELRCHYGNTLYRILYRRSRNLFILLHALRKNTGRIPAADIAIARARWDDFKARMDAARRTPPRAAGHDAP